MTMIEKVAIALSLQNGHIRLEDQWKFLVNPFKDKMKRDAKAAILAMREPTEEMLKAFYGDTPIEQWLGKDWQDMIDAALKEQ